MQMRGTQTLSMRIQGIVGGFLESWASVELDARFGACVESREK